MGRVLLARDTVLGRDVAIKLLRDDLGLPPETRNELLVRMRHEAQAAARVTHPNLVTLHDMGESEDEGVYLVFEYVPGKTLREAIDEGGPLPKAEVARLARELGSALDSAHAAGVLHRDIKPENIMLAPHGAKIADFGIARIPDSTLTRAGGLVGTPAYCAPEALSTGSFSKTSDQFSLAATLYEAVFGERAFPGEDAMTVAARIATQPPAPLASRHGFAPEVDEALRRAMSKDPNERFTSCAEFTNQLIESLGENPAHYAQSPLLPYRLGSRKSRAMLGAFALGAVAILLVMAAIRRAPAPAAAPIVIPSPIVSAAPLPVAPEPAPKAAPARVRAPRTEAPIEEEENDAGTDEDDAGLESREAPPTSPSLPPLPPPFADPFVRDPSPATKVAPFSAPSSLVPPLGGIFQQGDSESKNTPPAN